MTVHIGLGLFTGQIPPGSDRSFAQEYHDVIELSRLAETLGFDSVWVSEHHGAGDGYLPSLLPMLGALAASTDRVLLGTGVLLAPFHDPLRLAEDAAVVDQLSGGRLILGLGLGWREEEFRMWGIPVSERVARTAETVEILRKAWAGERFSHDGKAFRFDRVRITPPPARDGGPPIYLGGFVEESVRRAGRLGDGYILSRTTLENAERTLRWAEQGAREAGKAPGDLGFALLRNAFVLREGDAWAAIRDGLAHQLGVYPAWAAGADTPDRDFEVHPPDEETMRAVTTTGNPQEVLRELRPFVQTFAGRLEHHLIVRLHYPGMTLDDAARAVEVFGEDVLPALKGD